MQAKNQNINHLNQSLCYLSYNIIVIDEASDIMAERGLNVSSDIDKTLNELTNIADEANEGKSECRAATYILY